MKQRVAPFILTLALAVAATPVFAQDIRANVSGRATGTPIRTNVGSNVEARKASTTERKASSTERRVEMQRSLAKRKAEHTARVLTATVERLGKIIVRLESRIAKVETAGGAVTGAKIFVAEARTHLSLATSSIALFASLDLSGEKAQENFGRVRVLAREIKSHIKAAHQSLMKAVRSLKGASSGVRGEENATSTSE